MVGIYVTSSHWLPAVVLGILRAGAAYVPVDRSLHLTRRCQILVDLGVQRILVERSLIDEFVEAVRGLSQCSLQEMSQSVSSSLSGGLVLVHLKHHVPNGLPHGDDVKLAYVLQTSGSTGLPKTVKVPHECIVPNVLDIREKFAITSDDVILLCSPHTFDPSVVEVSPVVLQSQSDVCMCVCVDECEHTYIY
jgi:non-ribosomal peptide synthetase component F